MIALYIDTSSSYLYSGILKDNELICELKESLNHDLSTFALDEISKMFKGVSLKPEDVDKIVVCNGPGSFTGIRIGVTIAKIFALSLHKEITTISSLEAMMYSVTTESLVVPMINARRKACFGAIYENGKCLLEGQYILIEDLLNKVKSYNKDYLLVSGDSFNDLDTILYDADIKNIIINGIKKDSINPHLVNPIYLKLTEAEEKRMAND